MRTPRLLLVLLLAGWFPTPTFAAGKLVVVGGGEIPEAVFNRFITLSGGTNAFLLVIPYASSRPEAGAELVSWFQSAKVEKVEVLEIGNVERAGEQIRNAQGIWLGGGDQTALMKALESAGLVNELKQRHKAGVTFGGTSAGAAVMSAHMIGGDELLNEKGLGLWPEVIVDQHFIARKRFNRSLTTVLNHSKLLGVGIDEGTAAIVSDRQFEVMGASVVMVIDAREARTTGQGEKASWREVRLHWLRAGEVFRY